MNDSAALEAVSPTLDPEHIEDRFRIVAGVSCLASDRDLELLGVDGVQPCVHVKPRGRRQLSAIIAEARRLGIAIVPRGRGTHIHVGNPPRRGEVVLTTSEMAAIVRHDAADMTVAVESGMTLEALGTVLARADQWLPIDPPVPSEVTVGGLIAADLNGSLRFSQGKVRDYLIGVCLVSGEGRIVRGGGRVVKNVAGYDLPKLMIGSHGTLGVILEATFKVRPRPASDRTLAFPAPSLARAFEHAAAVIDGPLAPFSVDTFDANAARWCGTGDGAQLVVRLAGEPEEVRDQIDRLSAIVTGGTECDADAIARMRDFQLLGPGAVSARLSVLPRDLAVVCERITAEAGAFGVEPHLQAHAGNGVLRVRLSGDAERSRFAPFLGWLRFVARQRGGFLVVEEAPAEVKRDIDVWGELPLPLELLAGVKRALDPDGVLSPGRYLGGI